MATEIKELKPCPFCGSNSLDGPHITEYIGDHYEPFWWIECNRCPCGMEVFVETDGPGIEIFVQTDGPIVKAWNKRCPT